MTKKTLTIPKCLLFDANTVITAYRHGAWDLLLARFEIAVPGTVARDESRFYTSYKTGVRSTIDLADLGQAGKIRELSATAEELAQITPFCDRFFRGALHAGEAEALALLCAGKAAGYGLCTADGPAIEAAVMLGFRGQLVCFEAALRSVGFTKPLRRHYKQAFFDEHVRLGSQKKLMYDL